MMRKVLKGLTGMGLLSLLLLSHAAWSQLQPAGAAMFCTPADIEQANVRLKELFTQDQAARANQSEWANKGMEQLMKLVKADDERRIEAASLVAKGCLMKAEDYFEAAVIFQHGSMPIHHRMALTLATVSAEMGNEDALKFIPLTVDRILMMQGKAQLFGTQGQSIRNSSCFCMWPIEKSFPDSEREKFGLDKDSLGLPRLKMWNKDENACPRTYCDVKAAPTPKNSIPGVW